MNLCTSSYVCSIYLDPMFFFLSWEISAAHNAWRMIPEETVVRQRKTMAWIPPRGHKGAVLFASVFPDPPKLFSFEA